MTRARAGLGAFPDRFAEWFASRGCFWQTTVVLVALAIVEGVWPHLDPHGFWLLWALTLFSGWTQPALAYSGTVQTTHLETVLANLQQLEEGALEREAALQKNADELAALLGRLEEKIDYLYEQRFGA